jgi:signal transduction histidine kinase
MAIIAEMARELEDGGQIQGILADGRLLINGFKGHMAVFSRDSEMVASNGNPGFWEQLAEEKNNLLESGILEADPQLSLSEPFYSESEEKYFATSTKLVPGRDLVLVGAFPIDWMVERQLSDLTVEGGLRVFLFSPQLDLLYPSESGSDATTRATIYAQHLASNEGSGSFDYELNAEQTIAAYSVVKPVGWFLVIEEPWEALLNPLLTYTELGPLILVPIVVLAAGTTWFAIRQLVAPLRALEARSAAITRGDYEAVREDVGGIAEINRLQQTLIYLARKVQSAQLSLRGYVGAITRGQEDERMRLAHELHDDTIQALIALNQKVQMAQTPSEAKPVREMLVEIGQMVEQTIEDLRRLTRDLRPLYLEDLGLAAALDMLAQETARNAGIPVEFAQYGREFRLSSEAELAIYRIAQEALNNSIQHAGAARVQLHLSYVNDAVTASVSDDGKGFEVPESPAEFAPGGHFGLLGMFERAEIINGQVKIESEPGRGTRVELTVAKETEPDKT